MDKDNILNNWKKRFIISDIVLLFVVAILALCLFEHFHIYDADDALSDNVLLIKMLDTPNSKSYGNEMRIKQICINGEAVDLSELDTQDWKWHEEWGYTLFQQGNHEFEIAFDVVPKSVEVIYIRQEGSGVCEFYFNGELEESVDMYRGKWSEGTFSVRYLTWIDKAFLIISFWVVASFVLFEVVRIWMYAAGILSFSPVKRGMGTYDFAKGIGILGIIIGHTLQDYFYEREFAFNDPITAGFGIVALYFILPMFYLIGGMSIKVGDNKKVIQKQLKTVLIPYSIFAALVLFAILIKLLFIQNFEISNLLSYAGAFLVFLAHDKSIGGFSFANIGPIWFIVAFCLGHILLNAILRVRNVSAQKVLLLCVFIMAYVTTRLDLPYFCLAETLVATVFLFIGYLFGQNRCFEKENNKIRAFYIVGLFVSVMLVSVNGVSFSFAGNNLGKSFFLGIIISTIGGYAWLREFIDLGRFLGTKAKFVKQIGRESFFIIFIHSFEYVLIPWHKVMILLPDHIFLRILVVLACRGLTIWLLLHIVLKIYKSRIKLRRQKYM